MIPNYYKRLGLNRNANKEEVKQAYRKIALQVHPDKNISHNEHTLFIEINEAYLILFDNEARIKYDIEFDFYFGQNENKNKQYNFEAEDIYENKFNENKQNNNANFKDDNLKDWSNKARKQGEEYSNMNFENFSNLILGIVKETGFQLGNTLLMFFSLILTFSGCGSLLVGIFSVDQINNIYIGIILLPIGIFLYKSSQNNFDNHKN
jgi:DnaJ-class molecular chaperone